MAATKKLRSSVPNFKVGVVDVTLDASYPTGGYPLAPSDFGFSTSIEVVLTQAASGYEYEYNYATSKLVAYRQNATTGALVEVAAAVNLSAVTVRCTAFGY